MRRAQWIVLLLLGACQDEHRDYSGPELFVRQNCTTCHGATGQGTALAPSLAGAARNWKRADLIRYLRDPQTYIATNERLRVQASHYSLPMTRFDMLRADELERLADHVLGLP